MPLPLAKLKRENIVLGNGSDDIIALLAQVLPLAAEQLSMAGYRQDPVGDMHASRDHGVLKKYHGRALMITTGACAIHCRYCFRRHFPYAEQSLLGHWREAMETLRRLPDTEELILRHL